MAGEGNNYAVDYELINSGKLVNKEGLLELSVKIKEYVAANAGGSSDEAIWVELDSISNVYNEDFATNSTYLDQRILNFISNYRTETYYEDSLFSKKVRCKNGNGIMFYIEFVPINSHYKEVGLICNHMSWTGNQLNNYTRQTYYGYTRTIGSSSFITWYNAQLGYPGADLPPLTSSVDTALLTDKVGCLELYRGSTSNSDYPTVRWRTITDFKNDLGIPSLPTDPSSDGDYVLQNTVSSGTPTLSWGTPSTGGTSLPADPSNDGSYILQNTISSGSSTLSWTTPSSGGTTYTAGTGIDIDANNEISVDATDLSYNDLQDKPTIPTVPTNISSFTNDAGYLTSHQSLTGYATQNYVDNALSQVPSYSAGTGISIDANGVISLALANASQEVM